MRTNSNNTTTPIRIIIPSVHAQERANFRGIREDTVRFGRKVHRQGLEFYVMLKKCLQDEWDSKCCKRVVNTIVIVGGNDEVVTVYKNPKAYSSIKK
jgi:hypothetical protein